MQPASTPPLPDPLAAGWKGKPVCEKLLDDDKQRVLRCTFPPGAGHDRHFHRPHFGYALSGGRMRLTDSNGVREATLTTGSVFTSEGTPWHEVLNIGDTQMDQGYYHGEQIKKVEPDVLFIEGGRYTTCDDPDPHFYFESPKMKRASRFARDARS